MLIYSLKLKKLPTMKKLNPSTLKQENGWIFMNLRGKIPLFLTLVIMIVVAFMLFEKCQNL